MCKEMHPVWVLDLFLEMDKTTCRARLSGFRPKRAYKSYRYEGVNTWSMRDR